MDETITTDALHEQAVTLIAKTQHSTSELVAKETIEQYNKRRREATAALRPILTEIWTRFEQGESVGGHTCKQSWAAEQGITMRWCQKVIAGPKKREANTQASVRFHFKWGRGILSLVARWRADDFHCLTIQADRKGRNTGSDALVGLVAQLGADV